MTKRKKIDMNFRPDSYWDEDALLANVKGEFRRRQILQAINDGESAVASPGYLPLKDMTRPRTRMTSRYVPGVGGLASAWTGK